MQVNKKTIPSKATLSGLNTLQKSHADASKADIQDASQSQKNQLKEAFKSLSTMLAGGAITAKDEGLHRDIRTLAKNTKPLEAKQTDLTEKLDKAKAGIEKAKSLFEKNIIGTVIKAIITNIDGIMKNALCQSIAKSFLTTQTRITPEDILKKTPNPTQKTEWTNMIKDMGILREDSKKPSFRVTPENLATIQTRLSHLEAQTSNPHHAKNTEIGSEISLCKCLIKAYTERLEIKAALKSDQAGVITSASSLATAVAKTLSSADFSSPEILLKKIISSCATDPTLRSQIQSMISDKDNPLRKVLVSVAGENAIHGLNIATSPEGLAIANTLINAGSVDIAKAFIEDPVGTLLTNKELFLETASTAFDQFVALLDNASATNSLIAISDGKLQQADISLLRDILPLAKEVFTENTTATGTETQIGRAHV